MKDEERTLVNPIPMREMTDCEFIWSLNKRVGELEASKMDKQPLPWPPPLLDDFTLRDFFAGLAMQKHMDDDGGAPTDKIAKWAYEQADAMLNARQTDDKTSDRG
jgi:hypothetical protein